MRAKTRCGRRKRPRSATRPSLPATTQGEYSATEFETSHESDDYLQDVPMADCINQHSDGSLLHDFSHESIDLLDKNICVFCNKGDEVLVCSERGCLVALHTKCCRTEPKFDDLGNFYCPHYWYRRAVNKRNELKKKVLIAKKALLSFLDKDVVMSDELEPADEPHAGDGVSFGDDDAGQGIDDVDIQPSQPKGDRPRKLRKEDSDQYEIAVEDQADVDGDCRPCREEEMLVDLVQDSMNWEKFDKPNKSETDEIRVLEQKESFETEDSIFNEEDVPEIIGEVGEEAEPLSDSDLGKCANEHSPDIAFVKATQESVVNSTERGTVMDKRKRPHREQKVSSTGSSMSETNDSDSDVISGRKQHGKRKVQKKAYHQNVASDMNEEVTSSRSRRKSLRLPKPVKNWTSLTLRRTKLLWTTEEETVLEQGVLRFSKENQTIPWRRILEFGRHVFHKTRTPVDLKDKWRNISSKEGCK